MLIDTHCHLFEEYYTDIDKTMLDIQKSNVKAVINSGCDFKTNCEVVSLIDKYEIMYGTIGIHPENCDKYIKSDLTHMEENLIHSKIVAIGEIGLDYYYSNDNKEQQQELFIKQLEMAEKYNFPVIIHSREATRDTLNILRKFKLKGVIHSYSGSIETAFEYIKLGYYIGINGIVTFKNCNLSKYLNQIPISNILLETDSPYLCPDPFRGKKNEPQNIEIIANFLSKIYVLSTAEVARITTDNAMHLFDINITM